MAVLNAYRSFNSFNIYAFAGTTISATSSKLSLIDPVGSLELNYADLRVDYGGSFKYLGGYLSSGTLKSATVYVDSLKYYAVTGTYDMLTYVDHALGTTDDFLSYVFGGNDTFNGSRQNDVILCGITGNDKFYGNGGNDLISTNFGYKSTVDGGSGNDYIVIAGNSDSIKGGVGADVFNILFWTISDKDFISDFNVSQGDMISIGIGMAGVTNDLITKFNFNTATSEYEPYATQVSVVTGASTSQSSDNYFIYDKKIGNLYYDQDATGATYSSELIVNFSNKPAFTVAQLAGQVIQIYDVSMSGFDPLFSSFLTHNTVDYPYLPFGVGFA